MATNNLVNRGVEAKEVEIVNSQLDMDGSETSPVTEGNASHALSDQSASYVQVIVQKHRRERLPAASSPVAAAPTRHLGPSGDELNALPATVFLACPALAALQTAYGGAPHGVNTGTTLVDLSLPDLNNNGKGKYEKPDKNPKATVKSTGKQYCSSSDDEAEEVEVLRLERVGEALAVRRAAAARSACGARRVRRRAARLVRAALAGPRLLLDLPVALLLHLERCLLEVVRGATVGGAVVAADALGKPVLAAAHNALAAALAAAAGAARGVREALRPLAGALGDALEPLARVAAALRLVHVELHCPPPPCRCAAAPSPSPV